MSVESNNDNECHFRKISLRGINRPDFNSMKEVGVCTKLIGLGNTECKFPTLATEECYIAQGDSTEKLSPNIPTRLSLILPNQDQ